MYDYQGIAFLMAIVLHIITCYPMYLLAKKAGYKDAIMAFIPILNIILVLNVAGMSGWWTLLLIFVPLVNIIFALYLSFRFFECFESGFAVFTTIIITSLIGAVVPFVSIIGTIALWWLALSDRQFVGELYGD